MGVAKYDVVLYGATGFTGRQAARYFQARAPGGLRWAVAGRSASKLEALAGETGASGLLLADSADPRTVRAMVAQARVVLTTAGPFAKYGDPVVDACVELGRDYVDITGETPWVRRLIDRHHAAASHVGTRIVPFCGFDSIPSDLGTLVLVDWVRQAWDQPVRKVTASFVGKGGLNGGTLDSMLHMADAGELSAMADPILLNPPSHRTDAERRRARDFRAVRWDDARSVWLAPFVMGPVNTRVVRRSAALFEDWGKGYGPEFSYWEAMELPSRALATAAALGMGAFEKLVRFAPVRAALARLGPAPGEGPPEETMDRGFTRARLVAEAQDGRKAMLTLSVQGDPGNRATVMFLSESALALATERESLPGGASRGGVLTPATALGLPLAERLRGAGVRIEVRDLVS
jgi:short subunit dehydrogenase-like uncharacterized protein